MTQTGATPQRNGGGWRKWKKVVKTKVEGGPRGFRGGDERKEKKRPTSVVSVGRVVAAIAAAGARVGGEGSSRILYDDSYR